METVLQKIIKAKRVKIEAKSALGIYEAAEKKVGEYPHTTVSLRRALEESKSGIIAEFKRRSPSKREIHPYASPAVIIPEFTQAGAAACSLITDTVYYGGSLSDMAVARNTTSLPLLRNDFILDPRQLFESRLYGADAVSVSASPLSKEEIKEIVSTGHRLGLEIVLEIHDESEIDKIVEGTDIVCVSNRDMIDDSVHLDRSRSLAGKIPAEFMKISGGGFTKSEEVNEFKALGFSGFIIGETLMERANPGVTLRHFINEL